MPIGPMNLATAGTLMELAKHLGNNATIDAYLNGGIDGADFVSKLRSAAGVVGENHRLYMAQGFDAGRLAHVNVFAETADDEQMLLDWYAQLDFTYYRELNRYYNSSALRYEMTPYEHISDFVWEKLGFIGSQNTAKSDIQVSPLLQTAPVTFKNWRYDHPDPHGYVDCQDAADRFDNLSYYDRWLTVPFASMRIWVPYKCTMYIVGHAEGTWNSSLNAYLLNDANYLHGTGLFGDFCAYTENPNVFQLFVDHDGDKQAKRFTVNTPARTYYTDWLPLRSWSTSCAPRGVITLASEVTLPSPGWYNISLRYNNEYFLGTGDNGPGGTWEPNLFRRIQITSNLPGGTTSSAKSDSAPGPHFVARWERTSLSALAHMRSQTITNYGPDARTF